MAEVRTPIDADKVIGEEYEAFKSDVLRVVGGKLAASKIRFADLDMDGFYNQAWYGLYTKLLDGQAIESRKGLLVQMTYRRAIDEYRTLHPDRYADPVVLETLGADDPIDETLDQQLEFKQFVEGMRSTLNQRELRAATLCYVYGFSRPEAAEQVGVRPKRMEKIMDEVSKKMRPVLASIKEGTWCEDRATLINQYALGALEPGTPEYEEAVSHLEDCPGCRRHVLGTRGLTAVTIPSGLLLLALTGAAAGAAGVATAAAAAGSGGAGAGAGAGGAGAGAAGGIGSVAQTAAIVASVAALAAGGVVVVKAVTSDEKPPPAATKKAGAGSAAKSPAAKKQKNAAKSSAKKKHSAGKKATPAEVVPPAAEPAPYPAEPEPEPEPEPEAGGTGVEFDLQ
jgi:DNA-directed RNA polymerase specialized sigma24 family protein